MEDSSSACYGCWMKNFFDAVTFSVYVTEIFGHLLCHNLDSTMDVCVLFNAGVADKSLGSFGDSCVLF